MVCPSPNSLIRRPMKEQTQAPLTVPDSGLKKHKKSTINQILVFCHVMWLVGVLVPCPGIKSMTSTVKVQSPIPWTSREFPDLSSPQIFFIPTFSRSESMMWASANRQSCHCVYWHRNQPKAPSRPDCSSLENFCKWSMTLSCQENFSALFREPHSLPSGH